VATKMAKLEDTIMAAQRGNAEALQSVVSHCQDRVHRLAVRMTSDFGFAEDATQEILIRIVTKLSTFRGESQFDTWVHRIAINYLLTDKKVKQRDPGLTFAMFSDDLLSGLADEKTPDPEQLILLNQLRIKCTIAMLMCLDAKHRASYVLGEVLEFDHSEAAETLGVTRGTFRQQLNRARSKVLEFTKLHCGLVSDGAPCSCPRRLPIAIEQGRVKESHSEQFKDSPSYLDLKEQAKALEVELRSAKLQRSTGALGSTKQFGEAVLSLVDPPKI